MSVAQIELPREDFEELAKWAKEVPKEGARQWKNTDLQYLIKANMNASLRERISDSLGKVRRCAPLEASQY
jgi:hypothetical protein